MKTCATERIVYIGGSGYYVGRRRPRRAGAADRPPRAGAGGPARASRPRTACRSGSPSRRRGSPRTWRRAPPRGRRARPGPPPPPGRAMAQRRADRQHGDPTRIRTSRISTPAAYARSSSRATRARPAAVAGRRARGARGPQRDPGAAEHDQRAEPDPAHQRRDDEAERRRRRVRRCSERASPRSASPSERCVRAATARRGRRRPCRPARSAGAAAPMSGPTAAHKSRRRPACSADLARRLALEEARDRAEARVRCWGSRTCRCSASSARRRPCAPAAARRGRSARAARSRRRRAARSAARR